MGAVETPVKAQEKAAPKRSMRERIDPKAKALDGIDNAVRISRKDPARAYVWANERPVASNTQGDVQFYANMSKAMGLEDGDGYSSCVVSQDGVFAFGAVDRQTGAVIKNVYGQVLMSCPLEFKELVDSVGSNLQTGQEEADRLDRLMISQRNLQDHMRGIGTPGMFKVVADADHGETHTFMQRAKG